MTGKNIEGHNKTKQRKSKVRNPSDGYNGGLRWRFSIIESGRAKLDQSAPPGGGLHNNGAFRANSNVRILSVIHSGTFEGVLRFIAGHSDVIPSIPFYELFFFYYYKDTRHGILLAPSLVQYSLFERFRGESAIYRNEWGACEMSGPPVDGVRRLTTQRVNVLAFQTHLPRFSLSIFFPPLFYPLSCGRVNRSRFCVCILGSK